MRLEVGVFHNLAVARFILRRVINTSRCSHKSQPLKNKAVTALQGVDGHFLYAPINWRAMLIPGGSDLFLLLELTLHGKILLQPYKMQEEV